MSKVDLQIHHPQPHEQIVPLYVFDPSTNGMAWFVAAHVNSSNANLKREKLKDKLVATLINQTDTSVHQGTETRRGSTRTFAFRIPKLDDNKSTRFHLFTAQTSADQIGEGNPAVSLEFILTPPSTTTLSQAVANDQDASITVNAPAAAAASLIAKNLPFVVQIDSELMTVTAFTTPTQWAVTRGTLSTKKDGHLANAKVVYRWLIPTTKVISKTAATIKVASALNFPVDLPILRVRRRHTQSEGHGDRRNDLDRIPER